MSINTKFDYIGPFIRGIAEYRIGGEIGYIDKKGKIISNNINKN